MLRVHGRGLERSGSEGGREEGRDGWMGGWPSRRMIGWEDGRGGKLRRRTCHRSRCPGGALESGSDSACMQAMVGIECVAAKHPVLNTRLCRDALGWNILSNQMVCVPLERRDDALLIFIQGTAKADNAQIAGGQLTSSNELIPVLHIGAQEWGI